MAKVIGHRGFPQKYPENTIASFLGALLHGADGVELDVRLARDGSIIVIHDPDLHRVSGKDIIVRDASLDEIRRAYLGLGQVVPTLSEVLEAMPRGYEIFIEIKEVEAAIPALNITKEADRLDDVVFISFLEDALRLIREHEKSARLGINIDSIDKAKRALLIAREIGLYSINPPVEAISVVGVEALKSYMRSIKDAGMKTVLWTVNDPKIVEELGELLDYIITDNPLLFTRRDSVQSL